MGRSIPGILNLLFPDRGKCIFKDENRPDCVIFADGSYFLRGRVPAGFAMAHELGGLPGHDARRVRDVDLQPGEGVEEESQPGDPSDGLSEPRILLSIARSSFSCFPIVLSSTASFSWMELTRLACIEILTLVPPLSFSKV